MAYAGYIAYITLQYSVFTYMTYIQDGNEMQCMYIEIQCMQKSAACINLMHVYIMTSNACIYGKYTPNLNYGMKICFV